MSPVRRSGGRSGAQAAAADAAAQAPTLPARKDAPTLLPITPRALAQPGDSLPRAALHGAGGSTAPSSARSRRSGRKVTFGSEEIKQFEAVGHMRSIL